MLQDSTKGAGESMEIDRRDLVTIAVLFFVFLIVATYQLGSTSTPNITYKTSGDEVFIVDLGTVQDTNSLNVLIKRGETEFNVFTGSPDNWIGVTTQKIEGYYSWKEIKVGSMTQFLRLEVNKGDCEIAEIGITDLNGRLLEIKSIISDDGDNDLGKLIDEQDKVSLPISYMSETFFDEIYFVRAAEDYLNMQDPFEWTHPPLGKLIIVAGIQLFGYNPFGWRIMGVVFAGLMIPIMYILGKMMFGTWVGAFISAFLLLFDFMHFTMGRMATVDTFVVFFSLVSLLFFFTYFQKAMEEGKSTPTWSLFGSVIFFSLALSTKWHSLLGYAGQMVILLAVVIGFIKSSEHDTRKIDKDVIYLGLKEFTFLVVGAVIYFLTFIPYMRIGHSLMDVYNRQWQMFNYHATLVATHPYSSQWWSWPIMMRPVWLYLREISQSVSSTIVSMGNPAVWWFGLFAIIYLLERAVREKDRLSIFISVIFFSQWLPFILIGRITFLYHYYLNVPILCLASAYILDSIWSKKKGKPAVILYLGIVTVLFLVFYPVISGQPVSDSWREALRWMKSWIF